MKSPAVKMFEIEWNVVEWNGMSLNEIEWNVNEICVKLNGMRIELSGN